jgi:rhodanese-related sulfurtransferase
MRCGFSIGVAAVALAAGLPAARAAEHTRETPQEVKKAVDEGRAVLLDVREKPEWDAGHIKGARLLPLSALQDGVKAEDLARTVPKGKVVYCHCAAGRRSLVAADLLKTLGYDVRALKPGYNDLIKAGFESEED